MRCCVVGWVIEIVSSFLMELQLEYRYNTFAILLLLGIGGGSHLPITLIGQIMALLQLRHTGTVLVAVMIFTMLSMRVHNDRLRPLGQLGHLLQIGSALSAGFSGDQFAVGFRFFSFCICVFCFFFSVFQHLIELLL